MRIIDADKLINQIEQHCIDDEVTCKDDVIEIIDNAPTVLHDNYSMGYQDGVRKVLSERPTGEWKVSDNRWGLGSLRCSNCNIYYDTDPNYCPNCGAYMKGAKG